MFALALHPHPSKLSRPLPFFHPTHALFVPAAPAAAAPSEATHWSSRASRKNRYTPTHAPLQRLPSPTAAAPEKETRPVALAAQHLRLHHPHARLKVHLGWDVSFWVAVAFVLGSAAWICNGHLLYTPLSPTPSPPHENAAAWLAFVGGTLFEVGAYLAYVESLPANTGHAELYAEFHAHIARAKGELEKLDPEKRVPSRESEDEEDAKARQRFRWIGSGSPRDLGFLASAIQFAAASVFWVSTITGLPGVIPTLTEKNTPVSVVLFWTPQVVGGTGFIVASLLLMLEEQRAWWRPAPLRIGWQVAVWNLIGAIGFTLCGALGYAAASSSGANYQSVLSTFWGSWAFMIGSAFQLWETLWREDPSDAQTH